jgi:glycosyltransferase involved in cell wall biosynthesis
MNLPAISCLCHTKNKKTILERAIRCFKAQTYPNKDLLIIFEDDNLIAPQVLSAIEDESISYLKIPTDPKLTLGQLRNIGVQKCKGDFFCVWDDDDWYHCQRLEHQLNSVLYSHKPASMMSYYLMFDAYENQAYLSHIRLYESSLLCNKATFKNDLMYAPLPKGEDTFLCNNLVSKNLVFPLVMPQLYIYIYHGSNTWHRGHFEFMFKYAQKLSEDSSFQIKNILDNKINEQEGSNILSSASFLTPLRYVK